MILLWGITTDSPFAAVLDRLRRADLPVVVVDQQNYSSTHIRLEVDSESVSGVLGVAGDVIPLASITAAFLRPYDFRRFTGPDHTPEQDSLRQHSLAVEETLRSWTEIADALFVNRLSDMSSNNSKPYQAELIRSAGFKVPDTLITTDPAAVHEFWRAHKEVIYKSISGVRSIVRRLTEAHQPRIADVVNCPTQFQERIAGNDYRVHVVGKAVFACEVVSEADDYRYAHTEQRNVRMTARDLPDEIAARCCTLAARCNLALAGIDLRLTPSGDWYCFEVNPSPAFTYYQKATGAPIDDAIAQLLAAKHRTHPVAEPLTNQHRLNIRVDSIDRNLETSMATKHGAAV